MLGQSQGILTSWLWIRLGIWIWWSCKKLAEVWYQNYQT